MMITRLDKNAFEEVFSIMEQSFPSDEYREKEEQKALFEEKSYQLYGMRTEEGTLIAFAVIWDLEEVAFLEHLAVNPGCRNGGVGGDFLQSLIRILQKPVCLEVELPENELARRRIGFYERNGFYLNEYDYKQPPMSEGKKEIPLLLMTTGKALGEEEFCHMRDLLYKEVYKNMIFYQI